MSDLDWIGVVCTGVFVSLWVIGKLIWGRDFRLSEPRPKPNRAAWLNDDHDQSVVMTRVMDEQRSHDS